MTDKAYEAITKARNQVAGGNPRGAVDTLEAYLSTDPHNTGPRLVLANIAAKDVGDREYGLFQLNIILDLEPDNADAMKAKATMLAGDKKDAREAEELLRRLLELSPTADVFNEYARFLRYQKADFKGSREYYEKAVAADPSNPDYHRNFAVLLLNDVKDYPKAKSELEILMKLVPEDANVRKNYDRLMREKFDADGNPKKTLRSRIGRTRS